MLRVHRNTIGSATVQIILRKLCVYPLLFFCLGVQAVQAQTNIESAESSFKYIANILHTFRTTGRLARNPGIDGADLEHFIALLESFYQQFSREFGRDSAMCQFYLDPENGRMTIEERAEISFGFMRDLNARLSMYMAIDRDFQDTVTNEFGSMLLRNINEAKSTAVSNQRLPSSEFDEAAIISFADTVCI